MRLMAMTLPQEFAWLASVSGASAIFLWDEDDLAGPNGVATHLHTFLNQVAPDVHETNAAAARYATATGEAEFGAFARHWNTLTTNTATSPEPSTDTGFGSGENGGSADALQITAGVVGLLGLAAGGIVLSKTGVLTRLALLAQHMAASAAAGPAGALTAAQAIATTRVANTATTHQLIKYLTEKIAPHLRRASDLLQGRLPALERPGGYGKPPMGAKGGERMDIGRRRGDRDSDRREGETPLCRTCRNPADHRCTCNRDPVIGDHPSACDHCGRPAKICFTRPCSKKRPTYGGDSSDCDHCGRPIKICFTRPCSKKRPRYG
jgi:hypothetical protein